MIGWLDMWMKHSTKNLMTLFLTSMQIENFLDEKMKREREREIERER